MLKIKKTILLISTFTVILANSQSIIQNAVNNTAVQSPNAAALFRYSETPISLYTGVPNISIPIYTIKEGDIEVPISISYHAGGIKVNDEASSVGLGWSLNAGGRVSHIIAGSNDFSTNGYYNIYPKSASGYIGSISGCPTPPWNNSTAVSSYYTNNFRLITDPNYSTLYPGDDFQPDLFLINLPTKSYKAYLDMPKTTKTDYPKFAIAEQPNIDFKLIPSSGSFIPHSNGANKFTVIDETGLSYYFDSVQEISTPLTGTYITGVSQYLSKIEDVKGRKINFYYTAKLHADRIAGCRTTRYSYTYPPNDPSNPHFTNSSPGLTQCNKQTIDESFIEKIEFSNGRIEFVWVDREDVNKSKKLSSIKIYNNYKLIKQFDFNYDYFIATDNLDTNSLVTWLGASNNKIFTHRLRLLGLTESITNEKYLFDYNSTYNLPNKLSFSSDFWGYYNGQANSDSFIPNPDKYIKGSSPFTVNSFNQDQSGYWYNASVYYPGPVPDNEIRHINFTTDNKHYLSDRRASLYSLAGLLTSIKYPTGGKTEFEYEPNTFSNYPIQSLLDNVSPGVERNYSYGGGIRIKSIKTTENVGSNPLIKNYIYDESIDNGTKIISNGNLSEFPKFYEVENRCYIVKGGNSYQILSNTACPTVYIPNIGVPDHPFKISVFEGAQSQGVSTLPQGGLVGYSKVIEKVDGKGRTESFFTNTYSPTCLSMIPRGSALIIGNGNLVNESHYDNNNSLLKETVYNYKFNYPDNLNTYFISGAILEPVTRFTPEFGGSQDNYPPFGGLIHSYSVNLYRSLLESATTKEYFPPGSSNFVKTTTLNTYNNKYLPSTQKITYPDNVIKETSYNYAQEDGNQLMISKNMVGIPLETIITQTSNGVTKMLSKTKKVYPSSLPDPQVGNFVLPKSILSYDISNNNNSFTEVTLDKYDATGNLIQYTNKEGMPVSIIWGYNSTMPIAKIEGTKYSDIITYVQNIITLSNSDAANPLKEAELLEAGDNLRKNTNLNNYQITTYTNDPLIGTTSVTPPSGIREYYKYDTTNRLEKIVDSNNKILKEYKYRYGSPSSSPIPNTEKSQIFTRTNCTGNTVGGTYNYIVPAGTYFSDVSELAANQKALDDINSNGQNVANLNGPCIPVISCAFTFVINPQFSYSSTNSVGNDVNFYVSFSSYGIWQSWTNGINIGKVGTSCVPSVNREITYDSAGRQWKVFIDTSGNCTVRLISGTVDASSSTSLNFMFQYQK
ncbi:DUF5977 domain-containing protein [Chryseobacterium paludis]|uniref:DUF5977 domain-containing protein n=1 Tax=Chryseobacterium paludis TaxID=2956784 RepID=UPI0021C05A60|nr:DUF5977 domain-containing protein [Chryseobacterium paludis]